MKGVVLEVKNGYAAVLKEDGSIIKIRKKCSVGDTIEIPHTMRFVRVITIAAAAVLIVLGASGGYYYTATAASAVTIHSSEGDLTLSLNRLDRVIKVEATGSIKEDTVQTLYSNGIRNCNLQDALDKATKVLDKSNEETGQNSFSIDIESKNQEKYNVLKSQAEEKGFRIDIPGSGPGGDEAVKEETAPIAEIKEEQHTETAPLQPEQESMQPAPLEQTTDPGQHPEQDGEPSKTQNPIEQEPSDTQGQSPPQSASDNQPAPEMEPGNSNGGMQQEDAPQNMGGQPDSSGGMAPGR